MKQIFTLLLFIFSPVWLQSRVYSEGKTYRVYIVVHGTWSADAQWYLPGGDFFTELLANVNPKDRVVPFRWSGKISHQSRIDASLHFAQFISGYPPEAEIIVIAHSHGGNVVMRATQELAKQQYSDVKIHLLYLLGTPISDTYAPDMNYIEYIYNLFSFEDCLQAVFGLFRRVFPPHPRMCNLNVVLEGKEPGHGDLHLPLIAKWIVDLHTYLLSCTNKKSLFLLPGTIAFFQNDLPAYTVDKRREERLDFDIRVQLAMSAIPTYGY